MGVEADFPDGPIEDQDMRLSRPRFTVRLIMFAVASIALAIAVCLWAIRPAGVRVELAPQPESANVDHDILDIVLTDLITNEEYQPGVGGGLAAKSEIVLADMTSGFGLGSSELDAWVRQKKVSAEAVGDLGARNPLGVRHVLARYRPSNPKILVRNIDQIDHGFEFSSQYPHAKGYVIAELPGYSRDGSGALVAFSFGPTDHGSVGFYSLKKTNGRWEIVERAFLHFA